jgi:hypothetical protein
MRTDQRTASNTSVTFLLFTTECTVLNLKSKEPREWFINCTAPWGGGGGVVARRAGNSWEYGNGGGGVKNKRTAIKEHHVNETKETERRNPQN